MVGFLEGHITHTLAVCLACCLTYEYVRHSVAALQPCRQTAGLDCRVSKARRSSHLDLADEDSPFIFKIMIDICTFSNFFLVGAVRISFIAS